MKPEKKKKKKKRMGIQGSRREKFLELKINFVFWFNWRRVVRIVTELVVQEITRS